MNLGVSWINGTTNNIIGHDVHIDAIFGNNLARLRELKKKYDPQNIFRHWHNINAV
jgi:FAD/FMN-containing dehydrogenase